MHCVWVLQVTIIPSRQRGKESQISLDDELRYLLESILTEQDAIQSKLQSSVTVKANREAWMRITAGVNARSSGVMRSDEDCKKTWKDVKSASLKERDEQKKTGDGGPVKQSAHSDIIVAIIGESRVLDGIDGMSVPVMFLISLFAN